MFNGLIITRIETTQCGMESTPDIRPDSNPSSMNTLSKAQHWFRRWLRPAKQQCGGRQEGFGRRLTLFAWSGLTRHDSRVGTLETGRFWENHEEKSNCHMLKRTGHSKQEHILRAMMSSAAVTDRAVMFGAERLALAPVLICWRSTKSSRSSCIVPSTYAALQGRVDFRGMAFD
eukprot:scaffold38791_cov19-Prasinocladus_malaysianus.AAC.3